VRLINPVLGRETRERLRNGRAFVAITVFVGLLLLMTWAVHTATNQPNFIDLGNLTSSGRRLLEWLTTGMLLLMMFFLPGIAASAVSGERERETLIPMQITMLSPRAILHGKILASSAFAGLLLIASMPLFATAYLLGGVSIASAVRTLVALALVGTLITAIAVTCSSMVRRTQAAVLFAYAVTIVVFLAAPFAYAMANVIDKQRGFDAANAPRSLLLPNPVVAVAAFADPSGGRQDTPIAGPLHGIRQGLRQRDFNGAVFDVGGQPQFNDSLRTSYIGIPDWVLSFGSLIIGTFLFSLLGLRRLRTPVKSER
jgi:ABC-2 type transport system permease protein